MNKLINYYIAGFRGLSPDIWKLAAMFLINRIGMMVVPFLSIYITQQLGWSKWQAGVLTSCYGIGSLLGSFIGGNLIDRFGSYRVMFNSLWMGGVLFMSLMFFKDFYGLCGMLFLTSTIADIFRPAAFNSIGLYAKPENYTRSNGLIRMAINLGIAIGPAIGGVIALHYSFDYLFIIDGSTCILAAVFLYFFLEAKDGRKITGITTKATGRSVYSDKAYLTLFVLCLTNLVVFFQILNVVPVFLKEIHGLDEGQIGLFYTLNGLMIVLLEMPIVAYLEARKKVFAPIMWGVLIIGLGHLPLLIYSMPILLTLILYNVVLSVGEIMNFPFINTYTILRAEGNKKGTYMGLMSMLFSLAFIIAPILGLPVVELLEQSYDKPMAYKVYWAGCIALSMVTFLLFRIKRKELDLVSIA